MKSLSKLLPTLTALFLLALPLSVVGQWSAQARLDTNSMRIGEQPTLTLSFQYQRKDEAQVRFPRVEEQLGDSLEVVEKGPIDTLVPHEKEAPSIRRLVRQYRVTSFDTGYYAIPPFHFRMNGDSIRTEPMLLEVKGVPLKGSKPKPIKGIHEFPYPWSAWFRDHWPWFAAGGALLLAALFLFLYLRHRKKSGDEEPPGPPPRPSHEIALEELEKLRDQEAWKEMEAKRYYTELTQTLRQYLEERYRIPALEETTGRILHELGFSGIEGTEKERLQRILKTGDMVKFAKERPKRDERRRALEEAIAFVERSIPSTEESEASQGSENGSEQESSRR